MENNRWQIVAAGTSANWYDIAKWTTGNREIVGRISTIHSLRLLVTLFNSSDATPFSCEEDRRFPQRAFE
jgi:hypothetical protein